MAKQTRAHDPLPHAAVDYILKHPDRAGRTGKTLFELAEERQQALDRAAARVRAPPRPAHDAVGPLGDAVLYSASMAALHCTLDVIVYSQYREAIVWPEILQRAASAMPVFLLLVYLTHVPLAHRFPAWRDGAFCLASVVAGCYLVYAANRHGYFHVMKAAPPVGTLWVWSVVEMSLPYAALNAATVLAYVWYNGFDYF
ncbi:hypothetical protein ACEQ8H_007964 [Pleosporales sp. CAS-2024a]